MFVVLFVILMVMIAVFAVVMGVTALRLHALYPFLLQRLHHIQHRDGFIRVELKVLYHVGGPFLVFASGVDEQAAFLYGYHVRRGGFVAVGLAAGGEEQCYIRVSCYCPGEIIGGEIGRHYGHAAIAALHGLLRGICAAPKGGQHG